MIAEAFRLLLENMKSVRYAVNEILNSFNGSNVISEKYLQSFVRVMYVNTTPKFRKRYPLEESLENICSRRAEINLRPLRKEKMQSAYTIV